MKFSLPIIIFVGGLVASRFVRSYNRGLVIGAGIIGAVMALVLCLSLK